MTKQEIEKASTWIFEHIRDYADSIGEYPLLSMIKDFEDAMEKDGNCNCIL